MSAIEIAQVVQTVAGTVSAVGAVGTASLGVRVVIKSFRQMREAGLSVSDSFRSVRSERARIDFEAQAERFEPNPNWRGRK